ncbi:MAG: Rieske (2Fe-2S) protein [Armatimonadetes bacterium]|nr:Rieske (2Fe-2S) protein [Armatimonadota bacterium]
METHFFTRRDFLRHLTLAGAAALLPLMPSAWAATGQYVPAGRAAAFPPGQFHAVTLPGGHRVYVRRLPGRRPAFLALSAACTHKGCPVAWRAADRKFHCPCHGGQFDATGRAIAGPPPRPLAALPTKVRNGILLIQA